MAMWESKKERHKEINGSIKYLSFHSRTGTVDGS